MLLLLQIRCLLNFYLFSAKYQKCSNKSDKKGQTLPTIPHRPLPLGAGSSSHPDLIRDWIPSPVGKKENSSTQRVPPLLLRGSHSLRAAALSGVCLQHCRPLLPPPCNLVKDKDGLEPEDHFDPGPVDLEDEPDIFPPDDNLKETRRKNVVASTAYYVATLSCYISCKSSPPRWKSLPYEAVKELRNLVKDYGIQFTFTCNLLVAIGDRCVMTSHDWKILLEIILSPMQYTVFMTEYRDQATAQMMNNLTMSMSDPEICQETGRRAQDHTLWQQIWSLIGWPLPGQLTYTSYRQQRRSGLGHLPISDSDWYHCNSNSNRYNGPPWERA